MTATEHDCPDADYWRAEALAARALVPRTGVDGPLVPGPCLNCRAGCPVVGGPCTVGQEESGADLGLDEVVPRDPDEYGVWRDAAVLARDALAPVAAGILPRPLATGLLAYDDTAPEPPRGAELLMSLAVAGPWIACSTGWALVVAASQAAAAVTRWVRS